MRKILVPLGAILVLLTSGVAHADSGACSYHGGVNCAIGPAANGDAICNDGNDSSTSYYTTQECLVNVCSAQFASSTYQTYIGSSLSWRQSLQTTISDLLSNLATSSSLDNVAYKGDVASENLSYSEQLQGLQSQEKLAIDALANAPDDEIDSTTIYYQGLINDLSTEHQANLTELASENNAPNAQACTNLWTNVQSEMGAAESYCVSPYNYGPYSMPAQGNLLSCVCKSGYTAVNGKCEDSETACQDAYGQSAYANPDGSCSCPAGDQLDATHHSCDYITPTAPIAEMMPTTAAAVPIATTTTPAVAIANPVSQLIRTTRNIDTLLVHQKSNAASSSRSSVTTVTAAAATVPSPVSTPTQNQPSKSSLWEQLGEWLAKLNPLSWF
jgi:hypothetical protein